MCDQIISTEVRNVKLSLPTFLIVESFILQYIVNAYSHLYEMDVSSLINSILADDGYNALSDHTKNKFEQYLHNPPTIHNEVGTNTANGKSFFC